MPFFESLSAVFRKVSLRLGRGIKIKSKFLILFAFRFSLFAFRSLLASPGISVMYFWSLFRMMFFLASFIASVLSSFAIILKLVIFFESKCLAITIGYGAMPAKSIRMLEVILFALFAFRFSLFAFDISFAISSATIFLSFESRGEK